MIPCIKFLSFIFFLVILDAFQASIHSKNSCQLSTATFFHEPYHLRDNPEWLIEQTFIRKSYLFSNSPDVVWLKSTAASDIPHSHIIGPPSVLMHIPASYHMRGSIAIIITKWNLMLCHISTCYRFSWLIWQKHQVVN